MQRERNVRPKGKWRCLKRFAVSSMSRGTAHDRHTERHLITDRGWEEDGWGWSAGSCAG